MNQISSGATGPRTAEGKRRTRYNAAKYGIFSKVILIGNESYTDLELILKGLHEQYRPETTLERILVDKLATLLWRYRRLLIAETAEIQFSINFPKLDANGGEKKFVEILVKYDGNEPRNLIKQAHDPVALDRCLDLLRALKNGIEASGFDTNRDSTILIKLYGDLNKSGKTPNLFRFIEPGFQGRSALRRKGSAAASLRLSTARRAFWMTSCRKLLASSAAKWLTLRNGSSTGFVDAFRLCLRNIYCATKRVSNGISSGRLLNSNACKGYG